MKLKINSLIVFLFLASCASKLGIQDDDILGRYELGMKYFEKEKYLKAESEFNYLILNNPGSKLALDAQYYMAESMFYQENTSSGTSLFFVFFGLQSYHRILLQHEK